MESIALDKQHQSKFTKKTQKAKHRLQKHGTLKKIEQNSDKGSGKGVIYLGHVPHGFYENEMLGFFSQFGHVTNVRVSRSAKSGRSRGYGFVEFKHAEVAKVVANTMHNYLMFRRRIEAHFIEPDKAKKYFKYKNMLTPNNYPLKWRRLRENRKTNANLLPAVQEAKHEKTLKKLDKKMHKLEDLGITYSLNVNTTKRKVKKEKNSN